MDKSLDVWRGKIKLIEIIRLSRDQACRDGSKADVVVLADPFDLINQYGAT